LLELANRVAATAEDAAANEGKKSGKTAIGSDAKSEGKGSLLGKLNLKSMLAGKGKAKAE
jgi:hypothetical protein